MALKKSKAKPVSQGRVEHACIHCGRALRSPESVSRGFGRKCMPADPRRVTWLQAAAAGQMALPSMGGEKLAP